MNYRMIARILGLVMLTLTCLLILPVLAGLYYRENVENFLVTMLVSAAIGGLLLQFKPKTSKIYTKEGFVAVGLGWILMSLVGALPFVIGGDYPTYIDALFETVSGFTTTGASVAPSLENMTRGCMFWRCFTHWIGGMGVLVFIMAVMPKGDEHSMHIMRAEAPGPVVGKLVPKMRDTALILYLIYGVMTVVEAILLKLAGMGFYDAVLHAFSTAGTGGFSTRSLGIYYYNSPAIELIIAVFMMLFGVNFNMYFLVLMGRARDALKNEELRVYIGVVAISSLAIAVNVRGMYEGFGTALRYAYFNVCAIISTTGFTHSDFNLWPVFSQTVIVLLMFLGSCAGSTGGGIKVSRAIMYVKSAVADFRRIIRPRRVAAATLDGKRIDEGAVRAVYAYIALFSAALLGGTLLISLDNFGFADSFTAALSCLSNVGPGLGAVGPMGSYSDFSAANKLLMSLMMLYGRLEIYPILILFVPGVWKRSKSAA